MRRGGPAVQWSVGSTPVVYPQEAPSRGSQTELELVPVQGNISMLAGAGGNITVQVGKDGVLLVDSGAAAMSAKVREAIRTLSKGQITYIVNTNDRPDHVGGNEQFARVGRPLAITEPRRRACSSLPSARFWTG